MGESYCLFNQSLLESLWMELRRQHSVQYFNTVTNLPCQFKVNYLSTVHDYTMVCIYVICFKLMWKVSQSILKQLMWLGNKKLCVIILILNFDAYI